MIVVLYLYRTAKNGRSSAGNASSASIETVRVRSVPVGINFVNPTTWSSCPCPSEIKSASGPLLKTHTGSRANR